MRKSITLLALILASCKLGPFPDEPVEQPAPSNPSGWNSPEGLRKGDAGVADDAAVPTAEPSK